MAGFNVSFLNPKLKKGTGQDYSFLVDQLSIKENQLASDGNLSPGDYILLKDEASKIRAFPGLTASNRSKIDVKVSEYEQNARVDKIKEVSDIPRMNRDLDDDWRTTGMLLSGNPGNLLQARGDALRQKLDRLTDVVGQLNESGDDPTVHINEFNETLNQYNDILQARDDVQSYGGSGEPTSGMTAFITTNSNGEIVDVEVGRVGSKTGYVETNGVYGGLQIYGKINRKEAGKNIFTIGDSTFSAADITIPDPQNPLGFRSNPLLSEKNIQQGQVSIGQKGTFDVVDLNTVRSQSSVPEGKYAEGADGFLYEGLANGRYKKYVGIDREKLGIQDNDVFKIPSVMESQISRNVSETVDGMGSFIPPTPASVPAPAPEAAALQSPLSLGGGPEPAGAGRARTAGPTPTSPPTQQNVFQKTIQSAGGFIGRLFTQ